MRFGSTLFDTRETVVGQFASTSRTGSSSPLAATIEVLLVEDSLAAAKLTLEALRDALVPNRIHLVLEGEEALRFLRRERPFSNAPRPNLILLDLNLPKVDGRAVLATIEADTSLMDIPVIVLTCSSNPRDVEDSYLHQVAGYITKPSDLDEYFLAIRMLKELWFKVMTLPVQAKAESAQRPAWTKRIGYRASLNKWVFIGLEKQDETYASLGYKGSARPMEILLVEDNPGDVMAIRLAVAEASETAILRVARDGEQALAFIESTDFQPSLIILDLNIPRIPGLTLLERWQGSHVPVVVFSSSQSVAEKAHVLALGACEFVPKPTDLDAFTHAVCGIVARWSENT
jgi:CheY-like chemotaxis protein